MRVLTGHPQGADDYPWWNDTVFYEIHAASGVGDYYSIDTSNQTAFASLRVSREEAILVLMNPVQKRLVTTRFPFRKALLVRACPS